MTDVRIEAISGKGSNTYLGSKVQSVVEPVFYLTGGICFYLTNFKINK